MISKENIYDFSYLGKKVEESQFSLKPFKHLYIENFLSQNHFNIIVNSNELESPKNCLNDLDLIHSLFDRGFKPIKFPGAVTDVKEYLNWRNNGRNNSSKHSACEGFGFVLRLYSIKSQVLKSLNDYIKSYEFNEILAKKFNLDIHGLTIDGGIQKYLDGYEISPHPDTRQKALTYMVNINPNDESEKMNHHTRYMKLTKKRNYVKEIWEGNPNIDRDWLPWHWLETEFIQNKNNSIVIFSPSNDTFHSVIADYNHLSTQRTQLYGNLWYNKKNLARLPWESLDVYSITKRPTKSFKSKALGLLPKTLKDSVKSILTSNIKKRNIPG